jgi:broad specificity phosphatase PhoE
MDELAVARHGESEASAAGVVGGDPPLTPAGREQARALGVRLAGSAFDVCLTSAARRATQTAGIALAGRAVPIETLRELGDVRFGEFDGSSLSEYRAWVESHSPSDAPAGGESRVQTLRRFAAAFRAIAARSERRVLVVAHGLTVRALLDERPRPVVAGAAYGDAVSLTRRELEAAVVRLERWCESPAW